MSLYRKTAGDYKPKATPYGGMLDGQIATTAPHLLCVGPTGRGKSRRVLGPALLMWEGPAVAISSKPDLIELAIEKRIELGGQGKTFVLDLSGKVPLSAMPSGVEMVVADPVALITDDDTAIDMCEILIQNAGSGSGDKKGDPFFEDSSVAPLAGLLRAAGDDGIRWVRRAVGRIEPPDPEDRDAPCWLNAIGRLEKLGSAMLAEEIGNTAAFSDRLRDSIQATMKQAVAPWWRGNVVGPADGRPFVPAMLEDPRSTLFMVAPADGIAAAAAVGVVDAISGHWRDGQTKPVPLQHLLVVCDELCNTLPWKKLPVVITESRSMGISVLAAVQDTTQFARRYNKEIMEELRRVFPAILVLSGSQEKDLLEDAAWAAGRAERHKIGTDHAGRQSQSSEMAQVYEGSDLLPKKMSEGRLLRGSRPGADPEDAIEPAGLKVDLHDLSAFDIGAA
ncbi:type IV secretory system conjugative DNA transfer family protein [Gordonia amicalis]|uniref:type IV secretory system conjugative DNA transfer family protein n=1 Tax=Gordonia amicalis TaxID=89053 RepID=UPI0024B921D9|nr:TraM recognition domain-containing protein [Gordonia amicalis]MDJ0454077.1 TraM recognition domain-containing protein [Gordonia amicalis]MDV7077221.1 TraM recognition domain-containing protein [Gordonia amicalis]